MFHIRLKGRLGNQLFIYAFSKKIAKKYHNDVLIYDRKKEKDSTWHSHLDGYDLDKHIKFTSNKKEIMSMPIKSKILFICNRLIVAKLNNRQRNNFEKKWMKLFIKNGLFLLNDGYYPLPNSLSRNTFFDGYFQSPRFFDDIRDELITDLTPRKPLPKDEKKFLQDIQNNEAVCVTIRLGDYLNNSTHQVCTRKFFEDAMDKMKKLHPNCKFYIFSDEIERAKKIFNFKYPVVYDSGKMEDIISLYVMSNCKHFIISNSSFSWWAQYLCKFKNKTVIAPDRWYAVDVPCDIYEKNWILLNIDHE